MYQPLKNPPTWRDRLLVHLLGTMVAVVVVFFGIFVALSLFIDELIPSRSMDKVPWPVIVLVGVFLGPGGTLRVRII